ncbi:MAG: hypothetical protein KC503_04580 [Myxococcales bacterium]|nr:hypothetical protein [Myxococcales bacterium]
MKTSLVCPKCQNNEIIYLAEVNDEMEDRSARWRLARIKEQERGFLGQTKTWVNMYGLVEAYVCRECGYTEFYTKQPETIPFDGVTARLLTGPPKGGPFR